MTVEGGQAMTDVAVRFEDVRDVGFLLFTGGWIVVYFANGGVIITDSIMFIHGAGILIAGLLAKNLERAAHDH
jgi:hypothetical protein